MFNFYDKEKYQESRGFSISNIEELCAGPIVKCFDDFVKEIGNVLSGADPFREKREWVNSIINLYRDGKSAERIANFFFK